MTMRRSIGVSIAVDGGLIVGIQRLLRVVELVNVGWMALFVLAPALVSGIFAAKGFGLRPDALGHYLEFAIIVQFAIALIWSALYAMTLRKQAHEANRKS